MRVHLFRVFSIGYGDVGTPVTHNLSQIIMLRFPECPPLGTRGKP
jgi:hypothetical protein